LVVFSEFITLLIFLFTIPSVTNTRELVMIAMCVREKMRRVLGLPICFSVYSSFILFLLTRHRAFLGKVQVGITFIVSKIYIKLERVCVSVS
jgi:hypothetical protein